MKISQLIDLFKKKLDISIDWIIKKIRIYPLVHLIVGFLLVSLVWVPLILIISIFHGLSEAFEKISYELNHLVKLLKEWISKKDDTQ